MSNERQYYEDIGYKPFLFYVVFGVSGDELEISREKHNVDAIPEGLDAISPLMMTTLSQALHDS